MTTAVAEDLLPLAAALADTLGEMPSRNRLMVEFGIGATRATRLRAELDQEWTGPDRRTGPDHPGPGAVSGEPAEPAPGVFGPAAPEDPGDPGPVPDRPGESGPPHRSGVVRAWPLAIISLAAFVAIWSGWVGLGALCGFGPVRLLPGIADTWTINTSITLPLGIEAYAAYALRVWLVRPDRSSWSGRTRRFARRSTLVSLGLGMLGQVAYHLLVAAHVTTAPWPITTAVSCLPVAVLGMGAALLHMVRDDQRTANRED